MTEFKKRKFSGVLPEVLVMLRDYPLIPFGSLASEFDLGAADLTNDRVLMRLTWYTTPKRIHGLLCHEGTNQLLFAGYECDRCGEIFLVPEAAEDETGLIKALRHSCVESVR